MIACVDVDYREEKAVAACVLFHSWGDAESAGHTVEHITEVEPYQPGEFYKRELPCLLSVLRKAGADPVVQADPVNTVVVDGYVWLGDENTPGLGGHLYNALNQTTHVVGVAKSRFGGVQPTGGDPGCVRAVQRGDSQRPLWVSAAGLATEEAVLRVRSMHGKYRIPTLLKLVDLLCRSG